MTFRCSCGSVQIEAAGRPIATTVCYCDDCQRASRSLQAANGAPPVLDADGGTPYTLYRRDRVTVGAGVELLEEYRWDEEPGTLRMVARCCGAPMYLDFEKGHWLSLFRARCVPPIPAVEFRLQTRFRPEGGPLPADGVAHPKFPPGFLVRLLLSWLR